MTAPISKMPYVRGEEHRPVPFQEESRLARQRWNAQQVESAPQKPGNEPRQPEAKNFRYGFVVADRGQLTLGAIVKRERGAALEACHDVRCQPFRLRLCKLRGRRTYLVVDSIH